jgi:hypothetical protein
VHSREYAGLLPIENSLHPPYYYSSEVMNMLMTEWNLEDALVVEREEGREERDIEIVKNALNEGASLEFVQKITGLNIETIKRISAK